MQSLGAIQHLASMGFEWELPSRITKRTTCFLSRLHTHSASTHYVTSATEGALVILYNGRSTATLNSLRHQRFREKVALTISATSFIHRPYHRRQGQPNITVCVCTCKSKNGRDLLMDFSRQSGGGNSV